MIIMLMAGLLLAVLSFYVSVLPPATEVAKQGPAAEAVAAAMLVYQKAAVDWCERTACGDGIIPSAGLVLPAGYATMPWIVSTAEGGRISTYLLTANLSQNGVRLSPNSVSGQLGHLTDGGPSAGLTDLKHDIIGRKYVPGLSRPVSATSLVPAGAPVVSEKVR